MTNPDTKKQFEQLLQQAEDDHNIVGFMLGGSRGKGYESADSDYDPWMIVKDEFVEDYKSKYGRMKLKGIDLCVMAFSEFKKYAKWGSDTAWDRYDFTHVKALIDKNGEVQTLIDEKGTIPKDKKREFICFSLDAYINRVYRSVKCFKKGNLLGARLEAALSITPLLDVLFALHNRPQPFSGYLEQELKKYPLKKMSWTNKKLLDNILEILVSADLKLQQKMLRDMEKLLRKEGFGKVFDAWKGKDKWAMTFNE